MLLLMFHGMAWGQSGTASISGDVVDQKGGAVAAAKVTLTHKATDIKRTVQTDASGHYEVLALPPGAYKLQVERSGFRTAVDDNVALLVNTASTLNLTLEVGQVTETLFVSEAAAPLNTHDASIGNVLTGSQISSIPLEGRSIVALLSLQPGAVYFPAAPNAAPNNEDIRSGSISGSRSDQSNITLDGVDINDPQNQTGAYTPSLRVPAESLLEFRTITTNYDASAGRSSAGQVAMVTKGGTNTFHGSAYWYGRNTATSSNEYFLKLGELLNGKPNKPPVLNKNVYGGSFGGPIWKDRFFFFGNYEGLDEHLQQSVLRNVPSATMRDGILVYTCQAPSST